MYYGKLLTCSLRRKSTKTGTRVHVFHFMKDLSLICFYTNNYFFKSNKTYSVHWAFIFASSGKSKNYYNQDIIENPFLRKFWTVKKLEDNNKMLKIVMLIAYL